MIKSEDENMKHLANVVELSWELEQLIAKAQSRGVYLTYLNEPIIIDCFDYEKEPQDDDSWIKYLKDVGFKILGEEIEIIKDNSHKIVVYDKNKKFICSSSDWRNLERNIRNFLYLDHERSYKNPNQSI